MDNPTIWQIACGEAGRRYDALCQKHDVMLIGPGRYGAYERSRYGEGAARKSFSSHQIGYVRSFATKVRPGDIVLLRLGHRVIAIGQVAEKEGYQHNEAFDDVYGWDLQHTQRVMWQPRLSDELKAIQTTRDLFAGRRRVPTFTAVGDATVLDPIKHLFPQCQIRDLADLPAPPPAPLTLDDLGEALFARGLSYSAVQQVRGALEKQRWLLRWYGQAELCPGRPKEHEVVAHVVVPLMLALGWSEQFLAVEWQRVDLAAFGGTPTDARSCRMICEAKGTTHGTQGALKQAKGYIAKLKLDACDKILVTNGGQFYLYRGKGDDWCDEPSGYLNVLKMRRRHVFPRGTDAVQTLVDLTPSRVCV